MKKEEFDKINQDAWETAAQAIMFKNKKYEVYSNKQIRGFFELSNSKTFEKDIDAYINKYSPQPSRGNKPHEVEKELKKMRELNTKIGKIIKSKFSEFKNPIDRKKFAQYLMWNVKIVEQTRDIDKIQLILNCEKLADPKKVIELLNQVIVKQNIQTPRKSDKRDDYIERRR